MVSIVIVSHSEKVAAGVKELADQMAQGRVKIITAGGLDSETLGTNVEAILQALIQADNPDGTLLLMDLGSAILSAEAALELLPPQMQPRVRFCAAPLVEGAIAAGVQASLGSDLETVHREALRALDPKARHLGQPIVTPLEEVSPSQDEPREGEQITLTLNNLHGLHARPAARFVQAAAGFEADITVENLTSGKGPASARSLNQLATLGARNGHQIRVKAVGPQATDALAALQALVDANFGELAEEAISEIPSAGRDLGPAPQAVTDWVAGGAIQAVPVAEGVALAPARRLEPHRPAVRRELAEDTLEAWSALQDALERAAVSIQARRSRMAAQMGAAKAEIFDAHLLILRDPELLASVRSRIFDQSMNAALAWDTAIREVVAAYQALDDAYLGRRAQDVRDVGDQVLLAMLGQVDQEITFPQPAILVAEDLTPTQIAQLDLEKVLGLVTVHGGPTSHSAILARSLGVPAASGVPGSLLDLETGTLLGLDGFAGRVWISPADPVRSELAARRAVWLAQRQRLLVVSQEPGITLDGLSVDVAANVGGLADADAALQNGADGIGVLRTEFLFLRRTTPPDEQTQYEALASIFEKMAGRPIIIRTLDVGGDKPLPYIDLPQEANPYLGVRAMRLLQRHPDLLLTQLRAILRAGWIGPVKIMFPMIANLDEVLFARELLEQAHRQLEGEGSPHAWPVETGIMVEIPAAALLSPALAPHVDFFSVGTNDLTQYTLAAERGNPQLAGFSDALHPAVVRLIQQVVAAAEQHSQWVGVCGELAGDPVAIPVLVGLGVRELSMNPGSIPRAKDIVRRIRAGDARSLAARVLAADSAPSARQLAREFLEGVSG